MNSDRIPFLDLKSTYLELKEKIDFKINHVLNSGSYILGEEVDHFERNYSAYCGSRFCISTANGLDSIALTLKAIGIGAGDEVIVPAFTFIATWLGVSQTGATPVGVDADPTTYNIDVAKIEEAISDKTKAILAVHLYGQPSDLDRLKEISDKYGIALIEDAAQAHGARYKGTKIGSFGDAVTWSFYPGKNLGAFGDGGSVTTNNQDISESIRLLRNYGSTVKYEHKTKGFNSRLDPIQAAVLSCKLEILDEWNSRRKDVANLYLAGINNSELTMPYVPDWADPSWHLFVVQHPHREYFINKMHAVGITTLIHYPKCPHLQDAYANDGVYKNFSVAESLSSRVVSLPIGPHLSNEQVAYIIEKINEIQ